MKRLDSILLVAEGTKKLNEYIALRKKANTWDGLITRPELREIGVNDNLFEVLKRRDVFSGSWPATKTYYGVKVEFDCIDDAEIFIELMATSPKEAMEQLNPFETWRNVYEYAVNEEKLESLIEKNNQKIVNAIKDLSAFV